jgi:endonuclease G
MHDGNYGGNVGRYQEGYPYDDQLSYANYFTMGDGTPFDPFWNSGYDHGHICPSADRQYSKEANRQTFFLTNMQPQRNVFNAGVWQQMEQQVRNWNRGSFRDTLYVCKGGTIDRADQISRTLSNGLIVPKFFFMAFLCKNKSGYKAMAFWIEHKDKDTDYPKDNQGNYQLSPYVTNIRELETLTGIDFFCNLDDETEERVETLGVENIKSAWGLK